MNPIFNNIRWSYIFATFIHIFKVLIHQNLISMVRKFLTHQIMKCTTKSFKVNFHSINHHLVKKENTKQNWYMQKKIAMLNRNRSNQRWINQKDN